jgi:hypothetical protein
MTGLVVRQLADEQHSCRWKSDHPGTQILLTGVLRNQDNAVFFFLKKHIPTNCDIHSSTNIPIFIE